MPVDLSDVRPEGQLFRYTLRRPGSESIRVLFLGPFEHKRNHR
jgi:hypothetical protein